MLFFEATQIGHAYCAISQRQRITNSRAGQKICTRSYGPLTILTWTCDVTILQRIAFTIKNLSCIYSKERLYYAMASRPSMF